MQVGGASTSKDESGPSKPKTIEEQEIFIKTESISEKKEAEKIKERLEQQREKRRLKEKLLTVKGLADSDSEEDLVSWVDKSRQLEKKKAEEDISKYDSQYE